MGLTAVIIRGNAASCATHPLARPYLAHLCTRPLPWSCPCPAYLARLRQVLVDGLQLGQQRSLLALLLLRLALDVLAEGREHLGGATRKVRGSRQVKTFKPRAIQGHAAKTAISHPVRRVALHTRGRELLLLLREGSKHVSTVWVQQSSIPSESTTILPMHPLASQPSETNLPGKRRCCRCRASPGHHHQAL